MTMEMEIMIQGDGKEKSAIHHKKVEGQVKGKKCKS